MKFETKMEIDLQKLKDNTKLLCQSYSDYQYKLADLRDNAHGLGLKIAENLYQNGINYCLVGSLNEALDIRKINHEIPILVGYYVTKEEIYDCINNNLTITIYSLEYLHMIIDMQIKDQLKIHILIDNGSNLQGFSDKLELEEAIRIIDNHEHLLLEGIYTELTTLGVEDEFYYHQVNKFYSLIESYLQRDLMIHLNESIMYHERRKFVNGIRFDLSLLGIEENINEDFLTNLRIKNVEKKYNDLEFPNIDLQLVFNITSEVMAIKQVQKGEIVGRNFVAKHDMLVAIVPIGHKDGITKAINYVGIKNFKRDILTDGIDYIVVEVTEDVLPKDKVYILNEERGIYDFLTHLKTNRYYLMSILNRNLKREYINEELNSESYL